MRKKNGEVRVIRPVPAMSTVPLKWVAEDSTPGPEEKTGTSTLYKGLDPGPFEQTECQEKTGTGTLWLQSEGFKVPGVDWWQRSGHLAIFKRPGDVLWYAFTYIFLKCLLITLLDVQFIKIDCKLELLHSQLSDYTEKIIQLEQKVNNEEDLKNTWLERNIATKGEVTILRERVDQQDRTIQSLESQLVSVTKLIKMLGNPAPAGELFGFHFNTVNDWN